MNYLHFENKNKNKIVVIVKDGNIILIMIHVTFFFEKNNNITNDLYIIYIFNMVHVF